MSWADCCPSPHWHEQRARCVFNTEMFCTTLSSRSRYAALSLSTICSGLSTERGAATPKYKKKDMGKQSERALSSNPHIITTRAQTNWTNNHPHWATLSIMRSFSTSLSLSPALFHPAFRQFVLLVNAMRIGVVHSREQPESILGPPNLPATCCACLPQTLTTDKKLLHRLCTGLHTESVPCVCVCIALLSQRAEYLFFPPSALSPFSEGKSVGG